MELELENRSSNAALRLVKSKPNCKDCSAWKICFADENNEACVSAVKGLLRVKGPYSTGEIIYQHGDKFHSFYIVQSGVVKTETETLDGSLNITGYFLSGELFGLEGIGSGKFPGRAIAASNTKSCAISYEGLLDICKENSKLQRNFITRLGQRIQSDEYEWKAVRNDSAINRLLYFLCDLCKRQSNTSDICNEVELPMAKQDIANFLGLSPETFSRALKKLERNGAIKKLDHDRISINKDHISVYSECNKG